MTSRADDPLALYDWYVDRGEPEQWIGNVKCGCFADRLSCHRFWANQFLLLLHAAAYWLLDTLRRWLTRRGIAQWLLDTLRLRLLDVGGRVRQLADRVRLHLAISHPQRAALAPPRHSPAMLMNDPGCVGAGKFSHRRGCGPSW